MPQQEFASDAVLRPSVLVIDDEEAYVHAMGDVLAKYGYEVHTADSAERALARLAQVVPDLILLDIRMPGTDGLMLLRMLRTNVGNAEFPILVVSGSVTPEESRRALASGANGVLRKPFTSEQLRSALAEFLPVEAS